MREALGAGACLLLILFAVAGASIATFASTSALTDAVQWVTHTQEVRYSLGELLSDVASAEDAVRSYVLTGNDQDLATYPATQSQVQADVQRLRTLTADNPVEQRNLDALQTAVNRLFAAVQQVIGLRRSLGADPTVGSLQTAPSALSDNDIRAVVARMNDEENRLLTQRTANSQEVLAHTRLIVIAGSVLACLSVAITAFVIGRTLTRRRQAEARLDVGRAFFAALLENLDVGVAACDAAGALALFNRAAREFHGLPATPLPPERWAEQYDLYRPDGRTLLPMEETPLFRALQGELVKNAELVIAPKHGLRRTVLTNGQAIVDERGVKRGAVVAMLDVTDRLRVQAANAAAEAKAEARALYETVFLNLADGLAIIGQDGRVVFWNPRMQDLYGVPAEVAIGRPIHEQTAALYAQTADPEETMRRSREAYATAMRTGVPTSFEYQYLPGPAPRDVSVLIFPIRGAAALLGHGRLVRDVTREREVDRLKDELVSVVSHELRTPLASLVGFAELLLAREFPEAERRQFLETMLHEGQRLTTLINDFLDLQRIESGRQEIVPVATALPPLLRSAVQAAGEDPARPIAMEFAEDLPLVLADPDRLRQVLDNLLTNARKYSPGGGAVRITSRVMAGMVEVAIEDQGLGIPADAVPQLFRRFYRVDNSDRRSIRGTGLGLAISHKLIEAHGGRLWAESAGLGHGSVFRFTLPVAKMAERDEEVLIVEDDPSFARLLQAELAEHEFASQRVAGAEAALARLAERPPRVVILDLLLPGLSGEGLLRRLQTLALRVPVVVVTVQDLDDAARRALSDLQVVAVLRKGPGVAATVASVVRQAYQMESVKQHDTASQPIGSASNDIDR